MSPGEAGALRRPGVRQHASAASAAAGVSPSPSVGPPRRATSHHSDDSGAALRLCHPAHSSRINAAAPLGGDELVQRTAGGH